MNVIDYDKINIWGPWLSQIISEVAPPDLNAIIKRAQPEFRDDITDIVFEQVGKHNLVALLINKLSEYKVQVYHGTRLSERELQGIRMRGLRPLLLSNRKAILVNMLQSHERWLEVQPRLDEILKAVGPGNCDGRREDNCIHVCFSRMGLIKGCNHYLKQGAEVDRHIVYRLFGDDPTSIYLLKNGRKPYLISFIRTFEETLQAANPHGFRDSEPPSFLKLLIDAWAYNQYDSQFDPASQEDCTAARFPGVVGPDELVKIEELCDSDL